MNRTTQRDATELAESQAARSIAPEDLRRGEYVAALDYIESWPSFYWTGDAHILPPNEPIRLITESSLAGVPLKIKSVCLPFACVKKPDGECRVLDVRCYRLVRLSRDYARTVWKALKKQSKGQH